MSEFHEPIKPPAADFILTRGRWLLVFQNLETPMLFEKRIIWILIFRRAIGDIISPGYRIISAKKL
jgi:hypothetical protein